MSSCALGWLAIQSYNMVTTKVISREFFEFGNQEFKKEGLRLRLADSVPVMRPSNYSEDGTPTEWSEATTYSVEFSYRQLSHFLRLHECIQEMLLKEKRQLDEIMISRLVADATIEIEPILHAAGEVIDDIYEFQHDAYTYDVCFVHFAEDIDKLLENYKPKTIESIEDLWS